MKKKVNIPKGEAVRNKDMLHALREVVKHIWSR